MSEFQVCPKNIADRVNLGLIPSSEQGWKTGCAALKSDTGGVLHIHANVNSKEESRSECIYYADGAAQFQSDTAVDTDIGRDLAEPTASITNGQDSRSEYSSTDRGSQFHNVNDVDTELSGDLAETTANITHVNVNSIEESGSECSYADGTAQFQRDNAVDTYIGRDFAEPTADVTNGENSCIKFPDFIKECQPATASFGLNSQNSSISGSDIPNNCQNSTVEDNAEQTVSKFDNLKQSDTSSNLVLEPNKCSYNHLEDDFNTDHVEAEKDDLNTDHIEAEKDKCSVISSGNKERYSKWLHWCEKVSHVIQQLLREVHGGMWQTRILHIEHVKSYAPHVDHIVLDLKCIPVLEDNVTDPTMS